MSTRPHPRPENDIVVTGLGVVSPWGCGIDPFWHNLSRGHSAIRPLHNPQLAGLPCFVAAAVSDFSSLPAAAGHPLAHQFALTAAVEAWQCAHLPEPGRHSLRIGLSSALGWGWPESEPWQIPAPEASGEQLLARHFQLNGPLSTCLSACAASTQALGDACRLLRSGQADIMLAGGADSRLHLLGASGYSLLGALTRDGETHAESASRPFNHDRNGFVMGEGAAFVVLESAGHAQKRRAQILGRILGQAANCDASQLTDPAPDGRYAADCIRLALQRSGLETSAVDYINAHGTGTPANDRSEIAALQMVFGPALPSIPISSFKSMFGHLSMAAGAIETVGTLLALQHGRLPPTLNCHQPEWPGLDFVPDSRSFAGRVALKNSFGFGGQNACLILQGC